MKTQKEVPLPLFIIERFENVWYIYNTSTCEQMEFETKELAETKLKELL